MFDVASGREQRRETQGYVAPPQARAFLEASRRLRFGADTVPPVDPIARAHLRTVDPLAATDSHDARERLLGTHAQPDDHAESLAAVVEVLRDAGIFAPQPRALLAAADTHTPRLQHIQTHMQFALERDHVVSCAEERRDRLPCKHDRGGLLGAGTPAFGRGSVGCRNGCLQSGDQNWPPHWLTARERSAVAHPGTAVPDDFLLSHDLVTVFQVGWTVLHDNVVMHVAEQVIAILATLRCDDGEIQSRPQGAANQVDEALASGCTVARRRCAGRHHVAGHAGVGGARRTAQ